MRPKAQAGQEKERQTGFHENFKILYIKGRYQE